MPSKSRSQGSLEYLIIIAVVLGIVATVVLLSTQVFGGGKSSAAVGTCKEAASQCKVIHYTVPKDPCAACDVACSDSGQEIFSGATQCCKSGRTDLIYDGSPGCMGGASLASLVGYWKLDDGSGATTADSSGHGYTGTLVNSPAWTSSIACKYGNCLNFSSLLSQQVSIPKITDFTTGYTVSAWIYPKVKSGRSRILHSSNWMTWRFDSSLPNTIRVYGGNGITFVPDPGITAPMNYNTWQFFALTDNGTTVKLYKNGVFQGSQAGNGIGAMTAVFSMGQGSGDYFNGTIDDVRIYNSALSAADILVLYNGGG